MSNEDVYDWQMKAPSPTEIPLNPANAIPDALPQERVTGDILRGYGPRRGNLEKLLRYWRPIMRREGGFRRCRVILADHPELYPLEPLCAWLHHETTGLWPNEGCHHPGMKNCRRKLKKAGKIVRGSLWSDSDFNERLNRIAGGGLSPKVPGGRLPNVPGKSYAGYDMPKGMHPEEWAAEQMDDDELTKSCVWALKGFMTDEPDWVNHIRDYNNWEVVGDDDDGYPVAVGLDEWKPLGGCGGSAGGCGCGGACGGGHGACRCGGACGGGGLKSLLDDLEVEVKVGKPLSSRSIKRIRDAIEALQGLLDETGNGLQMKDDDSDEVLIVAEPEELFALKSHIDPILEYHGLESAVFEDGISIKSLDNESYEAIAVALDAFDEI